MSLKFSPRGPSQLPITPPDTPLPRDALGLVHESFLPLHRKGCSAATPTSNALPRRCFSPALDTAEATLQVLCPVLAPSLREGRGGAGGSPEQGSGLGVAQPGEKEAQE